MKTEINFTQLFNLIAEHTKKNLSEKLSDLKTKQEIERQKAVRKHYKQKLLLSKRQNEEMSNMRGKHRQQISDLRERMMR